MRAAGPCLTDSVAANEKGQRAMGWLAGLTALFSAKATNDGTLCCICSDGGPLDTD